MSDLRNFIVVVGCGFVGSVFTDEMLKRMFAGKLPQNFRFIDFDKVDDRNSANQNFTLHDVGRLKAVVLDERAMRAGKFSEAITDRLTAENAEEMLKGARLIIDGVDNLATRQLLWSYGMANDIPVLHLGIASEEQSTGKVEWSYPGHDTFSLSPIRTAGRTISDPKSGETPPCELARMRGVGLNVGFAAAMSAAIFLGFDPESNLEGKPPREWMTEWAGTPTGHIPLRTTWEYVPTAENEEADLAAVA
jgi:hypothetical protein